MTKPIFIGIDFSEDTLDVWLHVFSKYICREINHESRKREF